MNKRLTDISRFLSYVLRHKPDSIEISLDEGGWAEVNDLLTAAKRHNKRIDRDLLYQVVDENDKQRFELSPDRLRIRAVQGHSLRVDLGLEPLRPPGYLYHGTADRFLSAILETGLTSRRRQHVHLSSDKATAIKVGRRHGRPKILIIEAGLMHKAGYLFYLSKNRVWLTEHVPAAFIRLDE